MAYEIDYLPFATDPNANVETQAQFVGSGHQRLGFTPGVLTSAQLNKILRQASVFGAAWAQVLSSVLHENVIDDGNVSGLATQLQTILTQGQLGFTPVQQGTGAGQFTNAVKLGWDGTQLLCSVDATAIGPFAFKSDAQGYANAAQVTAIAQAEGYAQNAANIAQSNAISTAENFANGVGGAAQRNAIAAGLTLAQVNASTLTQQTFANGENSNKLATTAFVQNAINNDFAQSLQSVGYIFLPGGLLLQWGSVVAQPTVNVAFARSFPNNCWGFWPTYNGSSNVLTTCAGYNLANANIANVGVVLAGGSGQTFNGGGTNYWFAIGN